MCPLVLRRTILQLGAAALAWTALAAESIAQSGSDPFADATFSVATGAGGVPLNVVESGDRALPAIVFIHGFRQSYLSWSLQFASDLKTRCHIVAFDLRGHGNSGQPWQTSAYDHGQPWADDVESVIAKTGVSRPLIVGWSFGGNVAMDFARFHPDIPVAGYVLVSTTAGMVKAPAPPPAAPPRPSTVPDLTANIRAVDASTALLFPPTVDPALRDQFRAAAMRVSPFVDRAIAGRAGDTNRDMLDSIHAPVTLVFGGKDPIISAALAQTVSSTLAGATVVQFPNAGHAPFIEDAQRFDEILDRRQCRSSAMQ
jgi:pimeloyl-ACP methyl ester carboxylesterase